MLLYNIWRPTDFLLKAGVDGEMDYTPVITASECVELVASALIPHDQSAELSLGPPFESGNPIQQRQSHTISYARPAV